MLDEESGFGFTVAQLETLNSYVDSLVSGVPGFTWFFTEDFPNGSGGDWTIGQWNGVLGYSWPAPQIYNSYMVSFENEECSKYSNCFVLVTLDSHLSPNWNSPSWVTGQINGTPWYTSNWNSDYWYNLFQ